MRITADVVLRARVYINPVKEREVDLRGLKIPLIENLGTTQDQFDTIDLSDNEIKRLDNFPRLKRLTTLLLSNNFINRIGAEIAEQIPQLESLILTNNKITSLSEVEHLEGLKKLTSLSLLDNPVVRQQHYRAFVIHVLPSLKVLDFTKVKLEERKLAAKLFRSEAGRQLQEDVAKEGKALADEAQREADKKKALSAEQKRIAAAMIDSAKTPEELDRVERMLRAGIFRLPEGTELPPAAEEDGPVANGGAAVEPAALSAPPAPVSAPPPAPAPAPEPVAPPSVPSPGKKLAAAPPAAVPAAVAPVGAAAADAMEVDGVGERPEGEEDENGETLTASQIDGMKVAELKEELKKRGLPQNGLKAELAARLKEALA